MNAKAAAPTPLTSQLATPFGEILRRAVVLIPGALGAAFADSDGELVDAVSRVDAHELAVLTAHYGVLLRHLRNAFGTWHVGSPEYMIVEHTRVDVMLHLVADGYYVILALDAPGPLAKALTVLDAAAIALRRELA